MNKTKLSRNWGVLVAVGGALGLVSLAFIVRPLLAQSVPDPALKVSLSGTNQLLLTITNAVGYANYEIHRTLSLSDSVYPWVLHLTGTQGQANFLVGMGIDSRSFFRASSGLDWDQDGITNSMDAQPSSTNAGVLSVTIDSPLSGETIQ
jgi:hypothetical protein